MSPAREQPGPAVLAAMACSAAITAQFIAGKAARDAFYLAQFDVTSLPMMVMATSVTSIGIAVLGAQLLRRVPPSRLMPWAFFASAAFFLVVWSFFPIMPRGSAVVLYLQISGVGPMLGSGFWLIATERFDPRTAKRRFGQIAGAGTLGGLLGGLLAERVAAVVGLTAMLPLLALLNVVCAWQIRRLAAQTDVADPPRSGDLGPMKPELSRSGLTVLAGSAYLRRLATLVLLGTMAAALFDYLFKVQAVEALGRGDSLLRFFAVYYASVSLVTFVVQISTNRLALEKLGLAFTAGTPSLALLAASVGAWFAPGLASAVVARGSESALRGSLFRSSYEIFYTPVLSSDKRAAKSIIDVGFDRLGDAFGGGAIRLLLLLPLALQYNAILAVAVVTAAGTLFCASRLNRGYVQMLERSLLNRAVELELDDAEDLTTRTTMLRTLTTIRELGQTGTQQLTQPSTQPTMITEPDDAAAIAALDPDARQILTLRSRDRHRIRAVLRSEDALPATLVPHLIPLLAWDPVATDAVFALQRVAEERVGQLIDALIDPNTEFTVRRRLARVFATCGSQRAADGLLLGLDDLRFEVRYQCARSLAVISEKNPRITIDRNVIFEIVRRETTVGRAIWRSERLLQKPEEGDTQEAFFVDEFVKDRSSRSLAHVFTLLSLVLPAEPLSIAFRGLHTSDAKLRGTALEYLREFFRPPSASCCGPSWRTPGRRDARNGPERRFWMNYCGRISRSPSTLRRSGAVRASHDPPSESDRAPRANPDAVRGDQVEDDNPAARWVPRGRGAATGSVCGGRGGALDVRAALGPGLPPGRAEDIRADRDGHDDRAARDRGSRRHVRVRAVRAAQRSDEDGRRTRFHARQHVRDRRDQRVAAAARPGIQIVVDRGGDSDLLDDRADDSTQDARGRDGLGDNGPLRRLGAVTDRRAGSTTADGARARSAELRLRGRSHDHGCHAPASGQPAEGG